MNEEVETQRSPRMSVNFGLQTKGLTKTAWRSISPKYGELALRFLPSDVRLAPVNEFPNKFIPCRRVVERRRC